MTQPAAPAIERHWLIALLGALVAFAPLSIDMYLPALPSIAREFGVTPGAAQMTLASYFIGMAVGQAFYGPLADHYGRKRPLYAGLLLYAMASMGCALSPNMNSLLAFRFLQALGGCAGVVIPMAVVRDLYDHQGSARVLSRLMLVMGVAPMLAPLLGAQLLAGVGWSAIFWCLMVCGLACLVAVRLALPETLARDQSRRASVGLALRTYARLLAERRFIGFALAGSFASAGMFAYIAGSPMVLIELHQLAPSTFSIIFGLNAFALIAASQINHRLLASAHPDRLLGTALVAMAVLGLLLLLAAYAGAPSGASLAALLLPLAGFMATIGFISPNTSAGAMAASGAQAGSASALLGTLRFGVASLAGACVSLANDGSAHAMGLVMAVCGIGALLSYRLLAVPASAP